MDIIKEVSKKEYQSLKPDEREEIYKFIEINSSPSTEMSLRTLIKLYHFYLYDKKLWRELGMRILKASPHKDLVWELMNSKDQSVKDQEAEYVKKTGRSRADFYRIRAELKPQIKKYVKAK